MRFSAMSRATWPSTFFAVLHRRALSRPFWAGSTDGNASLRPQVTGAERNRWKIQHPVSQKFTKTDLAKFENTWDQKPHIVSRGAEKNFVEFMAELSEKKPPLPDEAYFRHLIARAVLFRRTEKLVHAQSYGGYRANIVTYSLAWLSHHTAQKIDLDRIWRAQALPQELDEAIRVVSKAAYNHLVDGAQGGNVTEWAKKEKCWEKFRTTGVDISTTLLLPVTSQRETTRVMVKAAPGDGTSQTEASVRVGLVPADEWFAISAWAKETANLAPWQRSLAYSLGRLAAQNKEPSTKQAFQGQKILDEVR